MIEEKSRWADLQAILFRIDFILFYFFENYREFLKTFSTLFYLKALNLSRNSLLFWCVELLCQKENYWGKMQYLSKYFLPFSRGPTLVEQLHLLLHWHLSGLGLWLAFIVVYKRTWPISPLSNSVRIHHMVCLAQEHSLSRFSHRARHLITQVYTKVSSPQNCLL